MLKILKRGNSFEGSYKTYKKLSSTYKSGSPVLSIIAYIYHDPSSHSSRHFSLPASYLVKSFETQSPPFSFAFCLKPREQKQ
ncbi:hypothetical protein L6452_18840 [Arctium lappa]|uniref:Uncharacterized protein n=1 Tax=Arctium lappa TaxID=4217 RepID=A0ACB9C7C8_ARCLA|nr:hypothetical protein L6452_18840 [Arctium lappa]